MPRFVVLVVVKISIRIVLRNRVGEKRGIRLLLASGLCFVVM
jgi:hypothetical protein